MSSRSVQQPETIIFCLDLDHEVGSPVGRAGTRLDILKHTVTSVVNAKRWCCAGHRFGLCTLQPHACSPLLVPPTSNADSFLEALQALQPRAEQQHNQQQPLDLGSLIAACQPLLQQQQQQACSLQPQHMHGGVLTPVQANSSTSGSSKPQAALRVVLVYCRSRLPAPVWLTHKSAGLAVDCLHVHHKPQPGQPQQELQEVYSTLEALVDQMSMLSHPKHDSLIYEASGTNVGKLLSCMSMMLSHPAQRPPQALAKPPTDLALADLQPLPSDAANLASGVPIMTPGQLPAAAAAGAWARPLSAAVAAGAADSSAVGQVAGAEAAAAAAAVVGVPVQGVAEGMGVNWGMGEGIAVGVVASTAAGGSSSSGEAAPREHTPPAAADAGDEGLEGLVESLMVSAVEESGEVGAQYPKIP